MAHTIWIRNAVTAALLLGAGGALAAEVELAGVFGKRAVLVVNGGSPQTVSIGQRSREGVQLLDVDGGLATVKVGGELRKLRLGDAPVRVADAAGEGAAPSLLRLVPDARGHYWTQGAVNGASVRFMIDTGATYVALSSEEARRAGIDHRRGRQVVMNTANGQSTAWVVTLDRVSIGGIVLHGVQASVHEQGLPVALLGMSFISRLDLRREAGDLVLRKRY